MSKRDAFATWLNERLKKGETRDENFSGVPMAYARLTGAGDSGGYVPLAKSDDAGIVDLARQMVS